MVSAFAIPFDYKSCAPSATPAPTSQAIGVGTGALTTFQLSKTYGAGDSSYARPIVKPVSGSVRIAVAGVELSGGAFSVNTTTGVVTLASTPATGAVVTAGFLFDTPVRFDIDRLDLSLDAFGAGRALAVPLVEVLA